MHEHYFTHFTFVETDTPLCAIRLTQPPYEGIVLYLGKEFSVMDPDTQPTIRFDYEIIEQPPTVDAVLLNNDFDQLLGGIFLAILERNYQREQAEGETTNEQ